MGEGKASPSLRKYCRRPRGWSGHASSAFAGARRTRTNVQRGKFGASGRSGASLLNEKPNCGSQFLLGESQQYIKFFAARNYFFCAAAAKQFV
jgi:hypothetical protein